MERTDGHEESSCVGLAVEHIGISAYNCKPMEGGLRAHGETSTFD